MEKFMKKKLRTTSCVCYDFFRLELFDLRASYFFSSTLIWHKHIALKPSRSTAAATALSASIFKKIYTSGHGTQVPRALHQKTKTNA